MNTFRTALIVAALASAQALAQPPPGGMPTLTPAQQQQIQAKMKEWDKWRTSHKNVTAVQQTLRGLGEMQKDSKTKLNKAQSQKVLGVMKTWRSKPVMTDAQALQVNKQLTASLNVAQLKKIATASERGRGSGGQRPPGGGGGGGGGQRPPGGGGGGGARSFDPSKIPSPSEFNPLNPASIKNERMRARYKPMLDELSKSLSATAK